MNPIAEDILMHYGVGAMDGPPGRGSGRYPLGSGENPNQHGGDFLSRYDKLKKEGLTETEIARAMGFVSTDRYGREHVSTTQLRAAKTIASTERRAALVSTARQLEAEGYNRTEIARKMGFKSESSVRSLLNADAEARMNVARKTADFLKSQVDEKGFIDVGEGTERELGVSSTKLSESLELLKMEGYEVYNRRLEQVTNPGRKTTFKLLCPPGTEYSDVYKDENGNMPEIHSIRDYISYDGGNTFRPSFVYPASMDSKRLSIRYAEDGGINQDGLVELRRGVKDLSLGEANYAQVRILVDGTHYIKGMAVYSDNLPDGVDVRFNTNKSRGTPMKKVLKEIHDDPDNPFGSLIKEHGGQSYYDDPDGNYIDPETGKKQSLSLINKRADEGDWEKWSRELPSQFLSKQPMKLIRQQLTISKDDTMREFEEIMSLTNPTVKKVLLQTFADDCDTAAVELKAAALPRQKYQVILPLESIKDNEVYAPNFADGEQVALIRFPHGGTFEIPILRVNNKVSEGQRMMTMTPKDAVGISKNVADRLSGADFDGDTVMVIPVNDKARILSTDPLKGLEGFDPKERYAAPRGPDGKVVDGIRLMKYETVDENGKRKKVDNTQLQMGIISNLITDMTIKGATEDELARAVRHSMVVIDAGKHELNYIQSEIDNGVPVLRRKYQGHTDENGNYHEGAATLISRAGSEVSVTKRQGTPYINQKGKPWYDPTKEEGALIYKDAYDAEYAVRKKVRKKDPATGKYMRDANGHYVYETEIDPKTGKERFVYEDTGKTKTRTEQSTQMAETDDAYKLSTGTPQEEAYAEYANFMKAMANRARKEMVYAGKIEYSSSAKTAYKAEVESLNNKLNVSLMNAPRERAAQVLATSIVDAKKQSNPDMTKEELKKARQQALTSARLTVGAKRTPVDIEDKEWEAIQAGAISENQLLKILNHADIDKVRNRAMPRPSNELSEARIRLVRSMTNSGYTTEEIAKRLGVSTSTVTKYL